MNARWKCAYCDSFQPTIRIPRSSFIFEKNRLLVRQLPIYGSMQNDVAQSVHPIILYLAQHSTFVDHPGERRISDTIIREYFWRTCRLMYIIQSVTVKTAAELVQNSNINICYNCFRRVALLNLWQFAFLAHYREPIQATNM